MAKVTYTNLFSEPRNLVIALITSSNVTDPTVSSSEYRKWIYSRPPDVKSTDFKGYPFIIVGPVEIDTEKADGSGDGKHKFVNFEMDVEIRTSDRGFNERDGKGLSDVDTISNGIIQTFSNVSNRNSLALNSLEFIEILTDSVEILRESNELIYRRVVTLSFRSRLAISA